MVLRIVSHRAEMRVGYDIVLDGQEDGFRGRRDYVVISSSVPASGEEMRL